MSTNAGNVSTNPFSALPVEQGESDDDVRTQANPNPHANSEDVIMADATAPTAVGHANDGADKTTSKKNSAGHTANNKKRPAPGHGVEGSPKKASKTNDGDKIPVGDPAEDEDTPSEVAAKIAVAEALTFYENGYADGRDGKYGRRAPADDDEDQQHLFQYYRGFCEGAHNAQKGKGKAPNKPAAQDNEDNEWDVDENEDDEEHEDQAPGVTNRQRARRATTAGGRDDDMDDEEHVDILVPAILPPVNQPPARGARHLNPSPGPVIVHALRHLDRPEGVDRRSITRHWHQKQREALYNYQRPGCFVTSELGSGNSAASQEALAGVIKGIWSVRYKGKRPPFIIFPIRAHPDAPPPSGAFVSGTEEQIADFVTVSTWSSSLGCVFAFPNADLDSNLACTFRAPGFEHEQADYALEIILDELDKSEKAKALVAAEDGDLDAIKDASTIEYVRIKEGRFDVNLFTVYIPPPSRDEERALEWRKAIAALEPSNYYVGEFAAHPTPFKCATCGCLRHPQGMCPTISEPNWLGFLPTPHNAHAAVKTEAQKETKVAVAGADQPKDAPPHASSSSKKPNAASGKKPDFGNGKNNGQKDKSGTKGNKKK